MGNLLELRLGRARAARQPCRSSWAPHAGKQPRPCSFSLAAVFCMIRSTSLLLMPFSPCFFLPLLSSSSSSSSSCTVACREGFQSSDCDRSSLTAGSSSLLPAPPLGASGLRGGLLALDPSVPLS